MNYTYPLYADTYNALAAKLYAELTSSNEVGSGGVARIAFHSEQQVCNAAGKEEAFRGLTSTTALMETMRVSSLATADMILLADYVVRKVVDEAYALHRVVKNFTVSPATHYSVMPNGKIEVVVQVSVMRIRS